MNFLLDISILFFLEVIEGNLYKGNSFKSLIEWLHYLLKNDKIKFISLHLSLIYLIFFVINNEISSFLVTSAILMKVADLVFKIYLTSKVDEKGHFSMVNILGVPDMEISTLLRYSGAVIYPLVVFIGVT